ncbi:MAG: zinc carboxypeptidase [Calothrix sp. SM1_5_4]|nr:zinc carboxypeptidase [Calothrix sp. SM1_5_4]
MARRHFGIEADLESLIESFGVRARHRVVAEVHHKDKSYPLYCLSIGSSDPAAPAVGYFAGAHGLEKIGSEVVLAYMHTILELLRWDKNFQERLQRSRLVFMPIVNPVGIVSRTRSNGNGVDLIRNSPLDAEDPGGGFYRGHRISAKLPYYRGPEPHVPEIETKALFEVVESELLVSRLSIAVDVHSGFGAKDRFWFPYSYSRRPFPHLPEAYRLKELFDQTYPHHFYAFEPMSRQYTVHGDPWDYLYEENRKRQGGGFFIPFTLEMGSWMWLKKNPMQVFSKGGVFDPVLPHRRKRILRRHLNLFDFLHRAVLSPDAWLDVNEAVRAQSLKQALELWYEK